MERPVDARAGWPPRGREPSRAACPSGSAVRMAGALVPRGSRAPARDSARLFGAARPRGETSMSPMNETLTPDAAISVPWKGGALPRERRAALAAVSEVVRSCGAFEWVALGYLSVSSLLLTLFQRNLPSAPLHIALHGGVSVLVLALCWASARWPAAGLRFARHWYPQAFFLFCFEELHYLVHLIFLGWYDRWVIAFDHSLAGVHPTVWLEQFARPALNDFMQMAYLSYFFYLVILAGILYARGEVRAFWAVMTSSVAAYTIGYLISIFFPVESPHHSLAALQRVELTGGFFTSLIGVIERFGRVHGAAFPSAHVSGSLVALLGAWRYRRWLFWTFLPFFLCMLVATVYGRYHYIADVRAGLVVGASGFGLGHWLMQWRGALPESKARRADRRRRGELTPC